MGRGDRSRYDMEILEIHIIQRPGPETTNLKLLHPNFQVNPINISDCRKKTILYVGIKSLTRDLTS